MPPGHLPMYSACNFPGAPSIMPQDGSRTSPKEVLLPEFPGGKSVIEPDIEFVGIRTPKDRLSVLIFKNNDLIEAELVHKLRGLCGNNDLHIVRQSFDHVAHQTHRGRVQPQFRFIQKQDGRKHFPGKVQQSDEREEAK